MTPPPPPPRSTPQCTFFAPIPPPRPPRPSHARAIRARAHPSGLATSHRPAVKVRGSVKRGETRAPGTRGGRVRTGENGLPVKKELRERAARAPLLEGTGRGRGRPPSAAANERGGAGAPWPRDSGGWRSEGTGAGSKMGGSVRSCARVARRRARFALVSEHPPRAPPPPVGQLNKAQAGVDRTSTSWCGPGRPPIIQGEKSARCELLPTWRPDTLVGPKSGTAARAAALAAAGATHAARRQRRGSNAVVGSTARRLLGAGSRHRPGTAVHTDARVSQSALSQQWSAGRQRPLLVPGSRSLAGRAADHVPDNQGGRGWSLLAGLCIVLLMSTGALQGVS